MKFWIISFVVILLFSIGPILPVLLLSLIGVKLDENSAIGVLPWLMMFTIPIGALSLLIWFIGLIINMFNA